VKFIFPPGTFLEEASLEELRFVYNWGPDDDALENPIGCPGELGDVNGDGAVNVLDVLAVINHILGIETLEGWELGCADCNGDGVINIVDALGIVNAILGIGECVPGACTSVLTPEAMEFLKALEPHFTAEEFGKLMALIKPEAAVPSTYGLAQNYPNPFNPTTTIQYSVVSDQSPPRVTLKIYNLLGQEVRTLVDEVQEPGHYAVAWNGRDENGRQVASGVYFYRLSALDCMDTKRMVLVK